MSLKTKQVITKEIPGYSKYLATSKGDIISKERGLLKGSINADGYKRVNIISDALIKRRVFVHRLIALAFIGQPTADTINHKDCIKLNNVPENLEWMTRSQQMYHAYASGVMTVTDRDCSGRFV